MASLGAGLYDVTARVPGMAPAYVQVDCRASANEVSLTCSTGSLIELRVIDSVTKAPVMGARGSVLRSGPSGFVKLGVASTDQDGSARLGPLPQFAAGEADPALLPIETMVLVQHPRYGDYSAELDPNASPLVVELQAGGSLAGRVHCAGALPTRIYMLSLEYRGADGFLEAFHLPRFSVTDLGGEFRFTNLIPGKYSVELSERFLNQDPLGLMNDDDFSVPTLHREEIEIRNGETTELVIDLGPSGRGATARVVGRVRLDGHNLEGAEVRVRGNESLRVVTDATGRFETAPFSIGESTWIGIEGDVRLADGRTRRRSLYDQSFQLTQDEVHEIDLDLYPLTIRVQVVDAASGQPVPEAMVSASATKGGSDSGGNTSTNSSGEAELMLLEPGEYALTASAPGFAEASSQVSVRAEGLSELTLLRLPHSVPCAGHVQVDPSGVADRRRGFAYLRAQGVDNACSAGVMLEPPDYGFTLERLAPGKYRTWIYLAGQQGKEGSFELGPDGAKDLVLIFVPAED